MGARRSRVLQAVTAAVLMGCGAQQAQESAPPHTREDALATPNGANLNGANLNGANLNGANLNGANLNGPLLEGLLVSVDFEGARLEGARALEEVWLEGSELHGLREGREVAGRDFGGARLRGTRGSGETVELRVDAVRPGQGEDWDVWTYEVSWRDARDGRWYPVCTDPAGAPTGAVALEGRWDYRWGVAGGGARVADAARFTFACEGAALFKCVRYGYKPWRQREGRSLAAHHQACTRLIRADFCGDGASHTQEGRWVNLHDGLGVQHDTEGWVLEAEWDEAGARCVSARTRARRPVVCEGGRTRPVCGARRAFGEGTLLMSETPPAGGRGHHRYGRQP